MRTAKCITIVLIVALIGILTIAQESAPNASSPGPSGAQTAECLLVITADPGIIPLNMETIASLVCSPAVLGKAATEVLGSNAPPDPRGLISIQWLSGEMRSSGRRGSRSSAEPGYDDMAAYEAAYERDYASIMHTAPEAGRRSDPPGDPPTGAPSTTRPEQNRQRSPGRDTESPYGGMGGGYGGSVSGGVSGMAGGGMMGGGMGGMGMGGMGGGMMGGGMGGMMGGGMGMGGMGMPPGMGGFGGAPSGPSMEQSIEQKVTLQLTVRLPDNAGPVAGQFMRAVAENLRKSLNEAYRQRIQSLDELLFEAKSHRDEAQERLQDRGQPQSPGAARIREQLDQIVDLSALTTQTPLAEAFELLKNSVQPPLPIVVQWNALDVMPADPAGIDGLPSMRLGTALDLLVKGPRGSADVRAQGDLARRMALLTKGLPRSTYRIQGDVIVVGPDSLARGPALSSTAPQGQAEIRALADQRNGLMRTIQGLEMELAGMEARRKAIQEQIVQGRDQADRQLAEDAVTKELKTLLDLTMMNIDTIKRSVDAGRAPTTDLTQAMESMTRARIELARRREEMMRSVGGGQFEQYNAELSRIAIDKAEKQAQLEVLHKQFGEVQRQLMRASTFDPEAARIRVAQETLDLANRRVAEIQARLTSLQPPSIVVIGVN